MRLIVVSTSLPLSSCQRILLQKLSHPHTQADRQAGQLYPPKTAVAARSLCVALSSTHIHSRRYTGKTTLALTHARKHRHSRPVLSLLFLSLSLPLTRRLSRRLQPTPGPSCKQARVHRCSSLLLLYYLSERQSTRACMHVRGNCGSCCRSSSQEAWKAGTHTELQESQEGGDRLSPLGFSLSHAFRVHLLARTPLISFSSLSHTYTHTLSLQR